MWRFLYRSLLKVERMHGAVRVQQGEVQIVLFGHAHAMPQQLRRNLR